MLCACLDCSVWYDHACVLAITSLSAYVLLCPCGGGLSDCCANACFHLSTLQPHPARPPLAASQHGAKEMAGPNSRL